VINAGEYKHRITIYTVTEREDKDGFVEKTETVILSPYAKVKTTKGFTLISSNTDFEKAYTNFTIRYPKKEITRDMLIRYNGKEYTIEYLNNVDEADVELEIQAKAVTQ
jgi:SPP1 family predicted phage head-tail adaptor